MFKEELNLKLEINVGKKSVNNAGPQQGHDKFSMGAFLGGFYGELFNQRTRKRPKSEF